MEPRLLACDLRQERRTQNHLRRQQFPAAKGLEYRTRRGRQCWLGRPVGCQRTKSCCPQYEPDRRHTFGASCPHGVTLRFPSRHCNYAPGVHEKLQETQICGDSGISMRKRGPHYVSLGAAVQRRGIPSSHCSCRREFIKFHYIHVGMESCISGRVDRQLSRGKPVPSYNRVTSG